MPTAEIDTNDLPEFMRDPEPREVAYTLISVDDHLVEPPDMFRGRVPSKFAGRFPEVVTLEAGKTHSRENAGLPPLEVHSEGRQAWSYEGHLFLQIGLNAVVGYKDLKQLETEPTAFAEMRPGCYDIHARVRDMDLGGIWASVNFPSQITGFAGTVYSRSEDPELGKAVTSAWNDWFYDEWYGAYPDRIVPMGITYLADPQAGAAEIRRNAARGFTGVTFPEMPHRIGYPPVHSDYWDPIFRACADTGTVLCLHVGSSGMVDLPLDGPRFEKNVTLFPALSLLACVEWVWSGVPARYPNLMIAMSEGGLGWVPMLMDRLTFMMEHGGKLAHLDTWTAGLDPIDILRRNFYFCMLDDPSGLQHVEQIGEDHIMTEVDYPHSDCTWPDTQLLLRRRFESTPGLTVEQIRKITHGNAARLFRHPLPPQPMPR